MAFPPLVSENQRTSSLLILYTFGWFGGGGGDITYFSPGNYQRRFTEGGVRLEECLGLGDHAGGGSHQNDTKHKHSSDN